MPSPFAWSGQLYIDAEPEWRYYGPLCAGTDDPDWGGAIGKIDPQLSAGLWLKIIGPE